MLLRSSRGIKPITLVAIGLSCLFNKTTELLTKEQANPELRLINDFVLTITANNTSPFFTLDVALFLERICCTETTITSPILP